MFRRSIRRLPTTNPDLHRHVQSTFKDSHYRQAPDPAFKAHRDPKSPLYRLVDWAGTPANKVSVVVAWSMTAGVIYYCWCVCYDLRGCYLAINKLGRDLHLANSRVADAEQRLADVQGTAPAEGTDNMPHQIELMRERQRAEGMLARNQNLVKEMTELRADLAATRKRFDETDAELQRVRKILARIGASV